MAGKEKTPLERFCFYCEHAHSLNSTEQMLCDKKGVVQSDYCCRAFSYDPLKHRPARPAKQETPELPSLDAL